MKVQSPLFGIGILISLVLWLSVWRQALLRLARLSGRLYGMQVNDFADFQQLVGKKMDYMAVFIHWVMKTNFRQI